MHLAGTFKCHARNVGAESCINVGPPFFSSSFQRSDLKKQELVTTQNQQILSLKKKNTHFGKSSMSSTQTEFLTQKPVGTFFKQLRLNFPKSPLATKSLKAGAKELSALLSTCFCREWGMVALGIVGFWVNNMLRV